MLPKISAALSKFISPVGTHEFLRERHDRPRRPRHEPRSRDESRKETTAPAAEIPPAAVIQAQPPASPHPEFRAELGAEAHPFLQLFAMLGSGRLAVTHILGALAYRASIQGKSRKPKRGAILDRKAE